MSDTNIKELGIRLQRLNAEMEVNKRKQNEAIQKVISVLNNISEEDISNINGDISARLIGIKNMTLEDIMNNPVNFINLIKDIRNKLYEYVENQLNYFEDELK